MIEKSSRTVRSYPISAIYWWQETTTTTTELSIVIMIGTFETDSGVTILVKVQPNARKESIIGVHGNQLKVAVTATPEKGMANKAIISLLAKRLKVKPSQVNVISGHTSRDKRIHIKGISLDDLKILGIIDDRISTTS